MTPEFLDILKKKVERGTALKKEIEDLGSKISEVTKATNFEVFVHFQNRSEESRIHWVDAEEIRNFLLKLLQERRTTKQKEFDELD